jgi:hypothetical protein
MSDGLSDGTATVAQWWPESKVTAAPAELTTPTSAPLTEMSVGRSWEMAIVVQRWPESKLTSAPRSLSTPTSIDGVVARGGILITEADDAEPVMIIKTNTIPRGTLNRGTHLMPNVLKLRFRSGLVSRT